MSLEAGRKLAHYEIVEPIGKGGMGEVFRARDTKLGRDVAIKVLPEEFARDKERVARFKREAKVLASLNHPNIAAIHGLEESEGTHYLVLELVPGETLAERIARGPIAIDEAVDIATKIAGGLEEAHEHGIVHRDLKPANIKLTPDDKVKVLDFGLAKAFVDEVPAADGSLSPTITRDATRAGVILGTAAYMSPEQAKGKRVDRRTDIFAFGSVLYEMLTGKQAFKGDGVSDVVAAVIKDEPDWSVLPGGSVQRVVRRCLAKPVARRFQHIGDARIELEEPAFVEMVGRVQRWWSLWVAAVLVAAVVASLALLRATPVGPKRVSRWTVPLPGGATFSNSAASHESSSVVISPDGNYLAVRVEQEERTRLFLRPVDQLQPVPVDGGDNALLPFFSPDSKSLAFVADASTRSLMKVSVQGGAPVIVGDLGDLDRGASWGSDGYIYFNPGISSGLYRVSADGGEPELLASPRRELGEKAYRFADALPDAKGVLLTIVTDETESFDAAALAVFSSSTGEVRTLIVGGYSARYSATGHLVYARAGALFAVPFDIDSLEVSGAPVRVLDGVSMWPTMGTAEFSLSQDGILFYAPGPPMGIDYRIVRVSRAGEATRFFDEIRPFFQLKLSPDGRSLAAATNDANMSLWVYDVDRGVMSRVVSGFNNWDPVWTPDGQRLTFSSDREGTFSVFSTGALGSRELRRLIVGPGEQRPRSWAPDGRTLAFTEYSSGTGWDVWMFSTEDETRREFVRTTASERHPAFSPNGRWVAFESDESGRSEIYVVPYPEGATKQKLSIDGGEKARWSPGGHELFFRNGNAMLAADVSTDDALVLGKPKILFESDSFQRGSSSYDVSADGKGFIMIDRSQSAMPPTELVVVQNWSEELKRLVPTDP